MDDLYIENFSKHEKLVQSGSENKLVSNAQNDPIDVLEFNHQMLFYLDQLEKEMRNAYKDFTDWAFIFDKVRKKLKAKSVEGILTLLDDLEELLDLDIPKMILKRSVEASSG